MANKLAWLWQGSGEPKSTATWAYRYLITTLKVEPDFASQLSCVEQINFEGDAPVILIRIFDARAMDKSIKIKDFASLDEHPDLILYEGYLEKETERVYLERREASS